MAQILSTFKTTAPNQGELRYFIDSSSGDNVHVDWLTIHTSDCNGVSRIESIQNLTSILIGDITLNTDNGIAYSNHYAYQIIPGFTGSFDLITGSCTFSTLLPLPRLYDFKNNDYNSQFNNAIEPRRGYLTGSAGTVKGGVFEVDYSRSGSSLSARNLEAILSNTAITASFQESNLYSKTWTSARYDGSKLNSGSLFYNDPALTFKKFDAVRYPLLVSSSFIRSQSFSDLEFEEFYFNPPFKTIRPGTADKLVSYQQGSIIDIPPVGQPVYELAGNEFKRITKTKLFIPNEEEIIAIDDNLARYELKPVEIYSGAAADNLFHLEFITLGGDNDAADTIYYYSTGSDNNLQTVEIRPGEDPELLIVSGTYLSDLGEYSYEAPASIGPRVNAQQDGIYVTQPWQSPLGVNKTFVSRVVSSSQG